ncbi:MAG TPA: cupin domain-containing protein [Methylomirabilota bacterium]|nr:cupin domain-containing protein [Methylomirabilota bacterium]
MIPALVDTGRYRGRFFEILQQTSRTQTAVMTIAAGQDGGPAETHAADQVVYVIEGEATMTIAGQAHHMNAGACALIPAGTLHHVRNPGSGPLFFFTVYAPPAY